MSEPMKKDIRDMMLAWTWALALVVAMVLIGFGIHWADRYLDWQHIHPPHDHPHEHEPHDHPHPIPDHEHQVRVPDHTHDHSHRLIIDDDTLTREK